MFMVNDVKKGDKPKKLNVNDLVNDVNDVVDLNDVVTLQLMHNSKFDKSSDAYFTRCYFIKLQIDKISKGDLAIANGDLIAKNIFIKLSNVITLSGDVLRLFNKKGDLVYSKAIVNNQVVTIDVDKHNANANAKKSNSIKSISLKDLDLIDLSKCNDVNDIKAQLQALKTK